MADGKIFSQYKRPCRKRDHWPIWRFVGSKRSSNRTITIGMGMIRLIVVGRVELSLG